MADSKMAIDDAKERGPKPQPPCVAPRDPPAYKTVLKQILFTGLLTAFSPYLIYVAISKYSIFRDCYQKSQRKSIKAETTYADEALAKRVWGSGVGAAYYDTVEFQAEEGWCGSATMRCVLKSLVRMGQMDAAKVPDAKRGPMTATKYANQLDEHSGGITSSTVIFGADGYPAFLEAIKKSNDPKFRLSINFLRSALFGAPGSIFFPPNFMKSFFGGHFSPVVAFLEKEDLVAVFDVNHNYGLFFVSSQRLYDSINTLDVQSGVSRAIVLSKVEA